MRNLYLIFVFICFLSGCVLFSPQREVQLNLPAGQELYTPGIYRVFSINAKSGFSEERVLALDRTWTCTIEKDGLTYLRISPCMEPSCFQPFSAGAVIDPSVDDEVTLSFAGGVCTDLFIRTSGINPSFNYQRLQVQTRERLGDQAWRMDLNDISRRIMEGEFSSRYIEVKGEILFSVLFPPGLWIPEDPSIAVVESHGILPFDIPLRRERGLRFLNREDRKVLEFYCTGEGRLLRVERSY